MLSVNVANSYDGKYNLGQEIANPGEVSLRTCENLESVSGFNAYRNWNISLSYIGPFWIDDYLNYGGQLFEFLVKNLENIWWLKNSGNKFLSSFLPDRCVLMCPGMFRRLSIEKLLIRRLFKILYSVLNQYLLDFCECLEDLGQDILKFLIKKV